MTSCLAAASLPVTSPMRCGMKGSARFRSAAKRPSEASRRFSRSSRRRSAPSPKGSIVSARSWKVASGLPELGAREHVDAIAVRHVEPEAVEPGARHRDGNDRRAFEILQREEHALPARLTTELGDLALHPEVGSRSRYLATPRLKAETG